MDDDDDDDGGVTGLVVNTLRLTQWRLINIWLQHYTPTHTGWYWWWCY